MQAQGLSSAHLPLIKINNTDHRHHCETSKQQISFFSLLETILICRTFYYLFWHSPEWLYIHWVIFQAHTNFSRIWIKKKLFMFISLPRIFSFLIKLKLHYRERWFKACSTSLKIRSLLALVTLKCCTEESSLNTIVHSFAVKLTEVTLTVIKRAKKLT